MNKNINREEKSTRGAGSGSRKNVRIVPADADDFSAVGSDRGCHCVQVKT